MNRTFGIIGVFAFVVVLALVIWVMRTHSAGKPHQESLHDAIQSAISNPQGFAREHFTGGVGAALRMDPATGLLLIQRVVAGSPAEEAGLREGDVITEVDGVATRGRTLAQNVESIRGFATASVTLSVQRAGSTNLQCVIHRTSWKSLGVAQ